MVSNKPISLVDYTEDCRMMLWDNAFSSYFRGTEAFQKQHEFQALKGSELVVRHLVFKYIPKNTWYSCFHSPSVFWIAKLMLTALQSMATDDLAMKSWSCHCCPRLSCLMCGMSQAIFLQCVLYLFYDWLDYSDSILPYFEADHDKSICHMTGSNSSFQLY